MGVGFEVTETDTIPSVLSPSPCLFLHSTC